MAIDSEKKTKATGAKKDAKPAKTPAARKPRKSAATAPEAAPDAAEASKPEAVKPAVTKAAPAPEPAAKPAPAVKAESAPAAEPAAEAAAAPSDDKVISMKPPIVVKELATRLGLKPFQVVHELMEMNIFATLNQTIDEEVAKKVCSRRGYEFTLEKRQAGGGSPSPL